MRRWFVVSLVALVTTGACVTAPAAVELMVYAAVSLTEALQENAIVYGKTTGSRIVFNFGASSTLALQIQEGAPADVFMSADEAKMDVLEKKGLLLPGTRRDLLSNVLAVVVEADAPLDLRSVHELAHAKIQHIAIAEPSTVPAGIYAKQYLQGAGLWSAVIDKLVPTENARAALAAVVSGNCEAGIVYKTDALISKRVRIALEVPRDKGPRISYPVAIVASTKRPDDARRFVAFLGSDAAGATFTAHGFLVLGDSKP